MILMALWTLLVDGSSTREVGIDIDLEFDLIVVIVTASSFVRI